MVRVRSAIAQTLSEKPGNILKISNENYVKNELRISSITLAIRNWGKIKLLNIINEKFYEGMQEMSHEIEQVQNNATGQGSQAVHVDFRV